MFKMRFGGIQSWVSFGLFVLSSAVFADPASVRWTGLEDAQSDFDHILEVMSGKTHFELHSSDFQILEDRDLATSHFQMRMQVSQGLPIHQRVIRTWTDLKTGRLIQMEALVEKPQSLGNRSEIEAARASLSSKETMALVRSWIAKQPDDQKIRSVKWLDAWSHGALNRMIQVKAQRGVYKLRLQIARKKIVESKYEEFPQGESTDSEFSLMAQVFPIYEGSDESVGATTPREPKELKYLKSYVHHSDQDPFQSLKNKNYSSEKFDPVLGEFQIGRDQGYWSMNYVKTQASDLRRQLPLIFNSFEKGGAILEGRFATISLHPNAATQFQGLNFTPQLSSQFIPLWKSSSNGSEEMVPSASLLGKPLFSAQDAWNRPARKLPDNNPVEYINDGFDEVQVYYAINTLFDSLRSKGFTDPELSTRPFNAFLYDPDISMRDNAYYTDDTINFTTYSPGSPNMARDNSTIWHELGHGVMDRLMGDQIELADTGGLSEGMADFVANMVVEDVTGGNSFPGAKDFRIINQTGFFLTNEVHDDGEAYGGTMRDFLQLALQNYGREGLAKVVSLTMESMRLTRNYPGLTAEEWFKHMLFADQQGEKGIRAPGELGGLLKEALAHRNFDLEGKPHAEFLLKNGDQDVVSGSLGSRNKPIAVVLQPEETATYNMAVSLKNGENFKFNFPVKVKVEFAKGPLQGAVHWVGEENGPIELTLSSEADVAQFNLAATGKCDYSNRSDGSCVDYAYVKVWNAGESGKPVAKKRFYLRVMPKS